MIGSVFAFWLEDAAVVGVMLNPDGRLWIDRLGKGIPIPASLRPLPDSERIIWLIADHVGVGCLISLAAKGGLLATSNTAGLNTGLCG